MGSCHIPGSVIKRVISSWTHLQEGISLRATCEKAKPNPSVFGISFLLERKIRKQQQKKRKNSNWCLNNSNTQLMWIAKKTSQICDYNLGKEVRKAWHKCLFFFFFFSYLIFSTEYWDKRPKCMWEEYHAVRIHEGEASILVLQKSNKKVIYFCIKIFLTIGIWLNSCRFSTYIDKPYKGSLLWI